MDGHVVTKPRVERLRYRRVRSRHDVAPLTLSQMRTLVAAAARELLWAEPIVWRELRTWRARASEISDEGLRRNAISAIDGKRVNVHGAALFCTLASRRSKALLRLLVAYQVMFDFLDSASESAEAGEVNGLQLHAAMVDAFDPARAVRDYYLYDAREGDGGYLHALVDACRRQCQGLRLFQRIRPFLVAEATRASVQALNHDPCSTSRVAKLQAWAEREFPDEQEAEWFELSAAASGASVSLFALLALASDLDVADEEIASVRRIYWPWANLLTTMLDSYVDTAEDAATGHQSYIAYYPNRDVAIARLTKIIRRCLSDASALPAGDKHLVVIASMIAMYLSKDSARANDSRLITSALFARSGSLPQLLAPVLRLWWICYGQRPA
jgi:tetraprenyl-beta-curcumene synthase